MKIKLTDSECDIGYLQELFRRPYVWLLCLSVFWFSLYLFAKLYFPIISEAKPWFLRLTTATFGSYLTAVVVDRSFRNKERRERERINHTALKRFQDVLNGHLCLLAEWYIASSDIESFEKPNSMRKLLEDDFIEVVENLDFEADAPTTHPNQDWLNYSAKKLLFFNNEINNFIMKHGEYLDSDTIEILESVANSTMSSAIIQKEKTRPEIQRIRKNSDIDWEEKPTELLLLSLNSHVETHVDDILDLIDRYEERGFDVHSFEPNAFSDDVAPSIGSARAEVKYVKQ